MSCKDCPLEEKCDRTLDLAIAGVIPAFYCEVQKNDSNAPQKQNATLPFGSYGRRGKLVTPFKAYQCSTPYEFYSTIVYAETRGKAKVIAMNSDVLGDDLEFTEIEARRLPIMDRFYNGKSELDWEDPQDRLVMVKIADYSCDDDSFDPDLCKQCSAKEFCEKYSDYLEEVDENE